MKRGSDWEMIRTLVGIASLSGVLIVSSYRLTLPAIKRNKAAQLKAAVFEVLPGAESVRTFTAPGGEVFAPDKDDAEHPSRIYAGFNAAGALTGIAVEAQGQGFQDVIKILYGYSPANKAIIGLKVLESKETPGLGDKIEKDAKFRANFADLDVGLNAAKSGLENPIAVVKSGQKTKRWEVDGITGATISSKAVGRLLNESASGRIPPIEKNLDALDRGAP